MTPTVDIIVVTYNSGDQINGCLDSIAASVFDGAIRTVVVDNASSDDTLQVVRNHAATVQLIENSANRGFAAACNQGIRASSSDLIMLLNPDARLQPTTLRRLVDHLAGNPNVAIVGPKLLHPDASLQPDISATGLFPSFRQALFEYTRLGRLFPHSRWVRDYFLTDWDRLTNRRVAMVQGACFLMRRAVLREIGLLDERFFLYFEETDLCKSAADRGWQIHYVGEAAAVHIGSQSMDGRRASARHFIPNLYRFHRKHYGLGEAAALWMILMPYHGLRVLRLATMVPFKPRDRQLRADLRTARERFMAHFGVVRRDQSSPFGSERREMADPVTDAAKKGKSLAVTTPASLAEAPARDEHRLSWRSVRLPQWLRIMGARPVQLIVPVLMAALVAALEGVSLGLLVPIAIGVTQRDFTFVRGLFGFSFVTQRLPGYFGPGADSFAPLFLLVSATAFTAAVIKNLLAYGSHVLAAYWNGQYLRRANDFVFARYLCFGKLYFDRANQGSIQTVLGYTGELLDLINFVQRGILTIFVLIAHLVVMLWISWRLTAFVLCFFPVMHYSMRSMSRRIERLSRQLNDATLTRHATAYNILSCVQLFRAYSQEAQAQRSYSENNEILRGLNLRIGTVQGLLAPFQEIITLAAMLAMIAFLAFYLGDREPAQLAVFLVFFYAARSAVPKFSSLYEIGVTLAAKIPKLTELARVLDDEEKFIVPDGPIELPGFHQAIEVRDLRFAYRDDVPVLKGLTVTFGKGEMTALVGPSGGGKSTLIHLLMGFYVVPPGSIFIDGHDIVSLRIESLRRHIALVAQDVFLFNDSLRANIAVAADRTPSDSELWEALRQARLEDFVRALPEGLDTLVGDRGMKLSGGEKQRVAICRALLKRAEILILDEATSALDSETERLIQEAMDELMKARTVIVIAHRLSTVRHADKIVFLEDGRIVEEGRLSALLARNGRFTSFWRSQEISASARTAAPPPTHSSSTA